MDLHSHDLTPPADEPDLPPLTERVAEDAPKARRRRNRDVPPDVEHMTDLGNARRLVARHGADLHYCHPWEKWLAWDGRWRMDDTAAVERLAKDTVRSIYFEAASATDSGTRAALGEHAAKSESAAAIGNMIRLAQSEPQIPVLPDHLDKDPYLLNVTNGTIDLRTGRLRPHERADLLTKQIAITYDPSASCPLWHKFLERIMAGNANLIAFLRRMAGYMLTGSIEEHALFVFFGTGANGKSVFFTTLLHILGDYGTQAPADLLIAKTMPTHPTDLALLFGHRLAVCSETRQGQVLDEARMKSLTGGDLITARRMREDFWTFKPTHKLILATNHKPEINTTDYGTWRRVRLIPFAVTISDSEKDSKLPDKLQKEAAGILAWAVNGCLEWQRSGLGEPAEITQATAAYKEDSDAIGEWITDRCILHPEAKAKPQTLSQDYAAWCKQNETEPVSDKAFGMRLSERGLVRKKSNGTRWWHGIGLAATNGPEQGDLNE